MLSGRIALADEVASKSAADGLYLRRLGGVPSPSTDGVVKHPHELDDVVAKVPSARPTMVTEVDELDPEVDSPPRDEQVVDLQVTVVLPDRVELLESAEQRVEQVHGLEGRQPTTGLAIEEVRQPLALDQIADQARDRRAVITQAHRVVVLDDRRAVAEADELVRVEAGRPIPHVLMRVEDLRGAIDARPRFGDAVELPFPPATDLRPDQIPARKDPARLEVEHFDLIVHLRHRHPEIPRRFLTVQHTYIRPRRHGFCEAANYTDLMSTNTELARIFSEMAAILELTGANVFRVNAHNRVAQVLREMTTDVAALADDPAQLIAIEGIGEGSAKKIIEYVKKGKVSEYDTLRASIPIGLLEVMAIPGLGPKTVRLLWEKGGVTSLSSLKAKLESGELEGLPRMGTKTLENIKASLEFKARAAQRTRIGQALPLAEAIVEQLSTVTGVRQVQYAGSLRRGRETIGDIDILASTTRPKELGEAFRSMREVEQVLAGGETKNSVRLEGGLQVDLRIVEDKAFGAALLYFTGSKEHNVVMRERAAKRSLRLNEYGLFPAEKGQNAPPQQRGVKPIAARTEAEVYRALDLPFIPPELRENRGEFDGQPPELIEGSDIKAELHAHTVASDGKLTIDELVRAAKARGYHTIAVTDHSQSSIQANGLSPDRLRKHIEAVRDAGRKVKGITVLAGAEVDILGDGHLDYDDELLAELDIVVASPHVALRQDSKKATERLVKAISHPLVNILGHPTGRMIGSREGLSPDIHALIEAAIAHDTALEINANPLRLDLRDIHVRAAVEAGALLAINTDAHRTEHFDFLRYGILTARRGWLTAEQCINTWSKQKLHRWLAAKKKASASAKPTKKKTAKAARS